MEFVNFKIVFEYYVKMICYWKDLNFWLDF